MNQKGINEIIFRNFAISGISSFLLSLLIGFLTLWDDGG